MPYLVRFLNRRTRAQAVIEILSTMLCKNQAMGSTSFSSIWSFMPQIHAKHLDNNQKAIKIYTEASMRHIYF